MLAARHKIPFYVAIPLSTIDWELQAGVEIPIEEREGKEVLSAWGVDKLDRWREDLWPTVEVMLAILLLT